MKYLSILFVLILWGCQPAAYYSVKKYDANTGNPIAEFEVRSNRQLEELNVEYNRETGAFEGKVGKATSQPSPYEQAIADMLPALIYEYGRRQPPDDGN